MRSKRWVSFSLSFSLRIRKKSCPAERRGKGGDPFDSILLGFSLYGEIINYTPKKEFLLKVWPYKTEAIHFLYGSLLSAYTIFYFKSSSFSSSFLFLLILTGLLFLNEIDSAKK